MRPLASTTPMRSASPSSAMPTSAPTRRPWPSGRRRSPRRSDRDGGWGSGRRARSRAASRRSRAAARAARSVPPTPLPASTTTLKRRGPSLILRRRHVDVGGFDASLLARPRRAPVSKSRASISLRSSWISAPWIVDLPRRILKPLSSGGLWLPVICTPPSASKWKTREVEQRRGDDADVDDVDARRHEARAQRRVQARRGDAAVAAERDAAWRRRA